MPSYTYVIIGREEILKTETITPTFDVSENSEYKHRFAFIPNFDYTPKVRIIIYFIRNQRIVSTSVCIELKDEFKNFITLDVAPSNAKPGQMVAINVASSPNALVGLLGIDKSMLILRSGNDLNRGEIWNTLGRLYTQGSQNPFDSSFDYSLRDFTVND